MRELKRIWNVQKTFNEKAIGEINTLDKKENFTKEIILHLLSECDEILREINWKLHRKRDKIIDRYNLKEEIIDVFKYWLILAQTWEMTPEEFIEEFDRKSMVVEQRFKQERVLDLLHDEKVICIDIDGVLADYVQCFVDFISEKTGADLRNFVLKDYNIYNALGEIIPGGHQRMKFLKQQFQQEGHEAGHGRELPTIPGSVEALKELKAKGHTVVLLTARPYKQYPRLFADTIEWLKEKGFVYDALIWDENKEERILKEFPNMICMIEDNVSNALKVANKGKKVYLLEKDYNQGLEHKNIIRAETWECIMEDLKNEQRKDNKKE